MTALPSLGSPEPLSSQCRPGRRSADAAPAANPDEFRHIAALPVLDALHGQLCLRDVVTLLLFGGSLLLIGLGSSRVLTYHEVLFAQPAKEMIATGDWVIPTIAGVPSLHKPPAMHWLIALFMSVTGSESELVARLPAVLASLATACLVALLATRWLGRSIGLLAGLIQLTTVATLMQGRMAEADALLALAVCGAMTAFTLANVPRDTPPARPVWLACLFYASTAVAFLAKGLIGPALIGVASGLYLLWTHEWRVLRFLLHPAGLTVAAIGMFIWPLAAYQAYPPILDAWLHHHVDRFQGNLGGGKPLFFYFYMVPLLMLPWTLFIPAGAASLVGGGPRQSFVLGVRSPYDSRHGFVRLLVCWFLPGFLLLCASSFKHKHYVIPLLPPLGILAAVGLKRFVMNDALRRHCGKLAVLTWALIGVVLALVNGLGLSDAGPISLLIAITGVGLLTAILFAHRKRPVAQIAVLFATAWLTATAAQVLVLPGHDSYRFQKQLADRVNQAVPPGEPVHLLGLPENQITYYLKPPLVRIDLPDDMRSYFLAEAGTSDEAKTHYALMPQFLQPQLAALAQVARIEVLDRCESINRYATELNRVLFVRFQTLQTRSQSHQPQ